MEIKEIRTKLNLSQQELAERLGVSNSAVSKWEEGTRRPGRLARREIARFLKKAGIEL